MENDFECYYNSFWGDAVYPIPDRDTNWMIKEDIKTFVKSIHNGAEELGLTLSCESQIGDLD